MWMATAGLGGIFFQKSMIYIMWTGLIEIWTECAREESSTKCTKALFSLTYPKCHDPEFSKAVNQIVTIFECLHLCHDPELSKTVNQIVTVFECLHQCHDPDLSKAVNQIITIFECLHLCHDPELSKAVNQIVTYLKVFICVMTP